MSSSQKTFSVTLINEKRGLHEVVEVAAGDYILDITDEREIDLPYSCRAGQCFDCLGKVVEGTVEQSDRAMSFLKPSELAAGYALLCATTPTSDCTILTHQADELFGDD